MKKAREMGYQPNALASNLRKRKSNTIGVVVPRISRHFFASVIAGIEEEAYSQGFNVIICQSLDQFEREVQLAGTLLSNRVDGVIISPSMETQQAGHLEQLVEGGIPVVCFDRYLQAFSSPRVLIDDRKAAFDATEHLIQNGCRQIAHFAGPAEVSIYRDRMEGYKLALAKHSLPCDESLIYSSRLMEVDGIQCAEKLLRRKQLPDGLFSANDTAAISAMAALKKGGIRIPQDIAVVGFSNEPVSSVIEPSLTTIDQPGEQIGKSATSLLKEAMSQTKTQNLQEVIINADLVVRESSQR